MSMSMMSFSVVSLIAMVPESEWRIPTLIVSCAVAGKIAASDRAIPAVCNGKPPASNSRSATARME